MDSDDDYDQVRRHNRNKFRNEREEYQSHDYKRSHSHKSSRHDSYTSSSHRSRFSDHFCSLFKLTKQIFFSETSPMVTVIRPAMAPHVPLHPLPQAIDIHIIRMITLPQVLTSAQITTATTTRTRSPDETGKYSNYYFINF